MIDWFINLITIDPLTFQNYEPSWWDLVIGLIILSIFFIFLWKMIVVLFHILRIQTFVIKEFINVYILRKRKESN